MSLGRTSDSSAVDERNKSRDASPRTQVPAPPHQGTVEQLVDFMYPSDPGEPPDMKYINDFLVSYRSFTTPMHVLNTLTNKYRNAVSANPNGEAAASASPQVTPLRTLNILKKWVASHFYDFEFNEELLREFQSFVQQDIANNHSTFATQISATIDEKLKSSTYATKKKQLKETPARSSAALVPRRASIVAEPFKHFNVLDYSPEEFARQLTLIEANYFRNIRPQEVRNQAWTKNNASIVCPNVYALTQLINQNSGWVSTEVVISEDLERRRDLIVFFLNVAKHMRELKNYNALIAIGMGLNHTGVTRLKKTWKEVPHKAEEWFKELSEVISPLSNHKNYREEFKSCSAPAIPYLPLYLKDLTFIEDGNPDYIDDAKTVVNFAKNRMICAVFAHIQKFQEAKYPFEPVAALRDYVANRRMTLDDNTIYTKSNAIEPGRDNRGGSGASTPVSSEPASPVARAAAADSRRTSDPGRARTLAVEKRSHDSKGRRRSPSPAAHDS